MKKKQENTLLVKRRRIYHDIKKTILSFKRNHML